MYESVILHISMSHATHVNEEFDNVLRVLGVQRKGDNVTTTFTKTVP